MKRITKSSTLGLMLIFFGMHCFAAAPLPIVEVNQYAEAFMQNNQVSGMAIDIYYNGQPYYLTYGVANEQNGSPVTTNTIFELASTTKTFTATVLALLVQQGKIQLNQPIGAFLPGELNGSNLPIDQITFQQLATHTAGLPKMPANFNGPGNPYNKQMFFNFLQNWQPNYSVGTQYNYSNTGFGVLGYALAGVAGMPYEELLQQSVLNPLNMNNTSMFVPANKQAEYAQGQNLRGQATPPWPMAPWKPGAGALRSTPVDMMNFLEANLNVGSAPENIKQAMQFAQQSYFQVNNNMTQGLAWAQKKLANGATVLFKDGSSAGFSSFIALTPSNTLGVVVMANKGKMRVGQLSYLLLNQMSQWQAAN